jgi:hypothetical protein
MQTLWVGTRNGISSVRDLPPTWAIAAQKNTLHLIKSPQQRTVEEQINQLLTRTPYPHNQQVKESYILAYFMAIDIHL